MEIKCPKCGAADPMYSKKRGVYVCEECDHEFAPEKPFEKPRVFISYDYDERLSPYALSHLTAHLIAKGRWDDLIGDDAAPGVLTDLRYIQARSEAGQVYELARDYNAALDVLPEFREEKEYLARRDEAMRRYNAALKEYAIRRGDYIASLKMDTPLEEPHYPELPDILKDENRPPIPETSSARAARLRHFENFLAARTEQIRKYPEQTVQIACNFADEESPVSVQALNLLKDLGTPFLLRSPRPSAPPFRPQCLRVMEDHESWVESVSVSPDGIHALSGSEDKTVRLWDLETGEYAYKRFRGIKWGWNT